MLQKTLYGFALGLLMYGCYATSYPLTEDTSPFLSSDETQEDLSQLIQELSDKHAGLFRYQTQSQWNQQLQYCKQALRTDKSLLEFYQEIARLIASIRCGHTKISLPKPYLDSSMGKKLFFPFELKFIDKKALIESSLSAEFDLPKGTHILQINGKSFREILDSLKRFTPTLSDGKNQTGKHRFIEHHFAFLYTTFIRNSEDFEIIYKTPGNQHLQQTTLKGVALSEFHRQSNASLPIKFNILTDPNVAILKLSSFDQSFFKQKKIHFQDTLQGIFNKINYLNIKHLVLDLRGNTGGDAGYVALFLSYLMPYPFKMYEKIEVNENYQAFGQVIRKKNTRPQLKNLPGLDYLSPQEFFF